MSTDDEIECKGSNSSNRKIMLNVNFTIVNLNVEDPKLEHIQYMSVHVELISHLVWQNDECYIFYEDLIYAIFHNIICLKWKGI